MKFSCLDIAAGKFQPLLCLLKLKLAQLMASSYLTSSRTLQGAATASLRVLDLFIVI
jgi:hypothetical protein